MNLLITGDSHCNGYHAAAADLAPSASETFPRFDLRMIGPSHVFLQAFHEARPSHITFKHGIFYLEEFARRLPGLPLEGGHGPFDWYGFSGPLQLFDIFFDPALYEDGQALASQALVRRMTRSRTAAWMDFLADARSIGLQCFVIENPLPFESSPRVARMGSTVDLQSFLALDRFAREYVKQALRNIGVLVIEIPAGAVTTQGFMDESFRHPDPRDPHHGNHAFSTLMLTRTASALGELAHSEGGARPPLPSIYDCAERPTLDFTMSAARRVFILATFSGESISFPSAFQAESLTERDGTTWLRFAETSGPATFKIPSDFAPKLSGRRIRVSVLARSTSSESGTRFAISVSHGVGEDGSWRWFWADREPRADWFEHTVPSYCASDISINIKLNDGNAEKTAAAELYAIAVEIIA